MGSAITAAAVQYRLQEWAAQIRECQNRPAGMSVIDWCAGHGITKANYLSLQSHAAHHKRVRNGRRHAFPSRKRVPETASYKGGIRCFNHRHYDGHPAVTGSQKSRIHGIIRLSG